MSTTTKRYVKVEFLTTGSPYESTGKYTYHDNLKKPLEEYELVLVPTRYGYSLAYVVEVNASPAIGQARATKTVAERIKSKTIDDELKGKRAKALEKQLQAKIEKLDKLERFKAYAKNNSEIAELVAELEKLQ